MDDLSVPGSLEGAPASPRNDQAGSQHGQNTVPAVRSTLLASRMLSLLCFIYRPGHKSSRRVLGILWSRRAQKGLLRAVENMIIHVITVGSG